MLIHAGRQIRGEYSELIRAAAEEGRLSVEEWGSKDGILAKVTVPILLLVLLAFTVLHPSSALAVSRTHFRHILTHFRHN